ncbi:prepilin-type N-terminal cleavage/methylation domain-containing protein [Opitutaceae bacterium TAV1]|nr:prepilin-type N-terminal cleavage/methylation domain-containing protein [Opitutaceae bacterium TAV1]
MKPSPLPARLHGFTLVELLTVIAIIGVLAGILIPVVGRVRESARTVQCTSNMRQIGTAVRLFMTENKGIAPPMHYRQVHLTWTYLAPWLGKKPTNKRWPMHCPNITKTFGDTQLNRTGYSLNGAFSLGENGQRYFRRVTDDYPDSRAVLMYEDPQPSSDAGGWPQDNSRGSWLKMAFWHGNKCNLLFLDGHVAQVAIGPDGTANNGLGSSKDYPQYFWTLGNYPKVPGWDP